MNVRVEATKRITYRQLSELYFLHLLESGKSKQSAKNAKSAIVSWCSALRIDIDIAPSSEFFTEFDKYKKRYVIEQIANRINKKKTYSSRLSIIKKIIVFYIKEAQTQNLPKSFGERLTLLLGLNNYSAKTFWTSNLANYITYETFLNWCRGKNSPSSANALTTVKIIEKTLLLNNGPLVSALPKQYSVKKNTTKYMKKLKVLNPKRYSVWTDDLENELQKLIEFKSSVMPPEGLNRTNNSRWTGKNEEGIPPAAGILKINLKLFFGFCCLPKDSPDPMLRGLGLEKENLTLGLLTEYKIVEQYLTVFRLTRAGGKYNAGFLTFISQVNSLLRKDTGYIFQKPVFAKKLNISSDKKKWQKKCLQTREALVKMLNSLKQEKKSGGDGFGFGRDPSEPIRHILDFARPISAIMQMIADMLSELKNFRSDSLEKAVFFRNIMLIALLQANPLRIKMISQMQLVRHLAKKDDGFWWIMFQRNEFKNRHSLKSDYEARLAPELGQLIESYIKFFRPKLYGAEESNYFFLKSHRNARPNKFNLSTKLLSTITFQLTRKYIADSPGFRPHSFRHVIATDIIKENGAYGFFLPRKFCMMIPKPLKKTMLILKQASFSNHTTKYSQAGGRNMLLPIPILELLSLKPTSKIGMMED